MNPDSQKNILTNIIPSKKVLSIFILSGGLVAAIIIGFGRDKASEAINFTSSLVAGEKISLPENQNWQSDLGKVGVVEANPTEAANEPEKTTTDTISQSVISNYLSLKENGVLDATSAQKLIDQTLAFMENSSATITLVSQLNIIPDNGTQTIADYGEILGMILKSHRSETIKNEFEIITKAAEEKNFEKIKELDSLIKAYESMSNELLKMPVPKSFSTAHLDMVNGTKVMASSLKEVRNAFSDPVKSLASMQTYNQAISTFAQSLSATHSFLKRNNVAYKQGTGGYYLLYGL